MMTQKSQQMLSAGGGIRGYGGRPAGEVLRILHGKRALVRFYRDSDASGAWEDTDQVLATDSTPGDGWTWIGIVSDSWEPGVNTFFARARDDSGAWSEAAPRTGSVWAEPGGDIKASCAPGPFLL